MEQLYDGIREDPLYKRLFALANVYTAEQFGLDVPEGMAGAIEDSDDWAEIKGEDWFTSAQAMAKEKCVFNLEPEYRGLLRGERGVNGGCKARAVVRDLPYGVVFWKTEQEHLSGNYQQLNSKYDSHTFFIN